MDGFAKITLFIFGILSLVSLIFNLFRPNGLDTLFYILITILFNFTLAFLIISISYFFYRKTKKRYAFLLLLLFSFIFSLWYLSSDLVHFVNGYFLSWQASAFLYGVWTILFTLLISLGIFLFFIIPPVLIYFKLEKSFKEEKINLKKFVLIGLFACMLILAFAPVRYITDSSPVTHVFSQLISDTPLVNPDNNHTSLVPVFNFSTNLIKPNIVIIMLEALPYKHLSSSGYFRNVTPNIDAFSEESITFTRAFSSAAHSEYSQTAFLSSRYPLKSSIRDFFTTDWPKKLIWDVLKEQGYFTYYITSEDDHWLGMSNFMNTSTLDVYSPSLSDEKYDYGSGNAKNDFDENTTTKILFTLNKTNAPFFLYTDFQATHFPYTYPEEEARFIPDKTNSILTSDFSIAKEDIIPNQNRYDNALAHDDQQVGRILNYLNKSNLLNNTIIILTADHGEAFGEPPRNKSAHGYGVYNEQVNIPLMIYVPEKKPQVINEPVKHIDVIPTLLKLANLNSSNLFQGKLMYQDKPIFFIAQNFYFQIGVLDGEIKFLYDMNDHVPEAYNITSDYAEEHNLIIDQNTSDFYSKKYGGELFDWYECQLAYYEKGYLINQTINCG